ncbi:putative PH domain containing protein Boi1/Boi2 [Septoria linicola]|nr:putative PH domain containing protein Boi1/Boi2 [Septoria linicola]
MQAITPITALEAGGEMFQRMKTMSYLEARTSPMRPVSQVSEATEIFDTDFEDESDYGAASAKGSFDSYDSRRRSQTTISSYDEARTPSPRTSTQSRPPLGLRIEPVQGPRGPHLFRSSQVSADFDFGYALQMSPLLPKDMSLQPSRAATAFSEDTVTQQRNLSYSLDSALGNVERDSLEHVRSWSTQEVCDWMYTTDIDPAVIESFHIHDIDGSVLLDLHFEDLKELDIPSFGKRHQLWNAICVLKGEEGHPSPQPTPFQDISRPCTSQSRRSPDRGRDISAEDQIYSPTQPRGKSKRRGRKAPKNADLITPAESVSIVAIEQLLPKPHKCAKGERCAKRRKQQRELEQLQNDHGIGRFPISPTKGGHIFMAGNPGNAITANNMIPNVKPQPTSKPQGHLRLEDPFRPVSDAGMESAGFPSVVASSDVLGPGQLPEFTLHEDVLSHLGSRDPQDNVKQFLQFQHVQTPVQDMAPPSPPYEMFPSQSISPFPAALPQFRHYEAPATVPPPLRQAYTPGPRGQLNQLPKLDIPRSQSAGPQMHRSAIRSPKTAGPTATPGMYICRSATASPSNICRSATVSPGVRAEQIHRFGTPSSVMDVPVTQVGPPTAPLSRDTSQSVPPNMQFRPQAPLSRSKSRTDPTHWRRPSMALPVVQEGEVFSTGSSSRPSIATTHSTSSLPTRTSSVSARDPAKHSPVTHDFGYGPDCSHSGWMRKRKTKILRHEWTDSHFRLKGTQLTQHASSRLSAEVKDCINVDDYAVACSSVSSNHKLSSAFKALAISKGSNGETKKDVQDATAFAFQLVPSVKEARKRAEGKTHHFAVKSKDERIDWMRELMLAKAREQKGKGFEVEVNGKEV